MNKASLIKQLEALETAVRDLRHQLLNDSEDNVRFPYYYKFPVTDLHLEGHKQPQRFYNLCAQHNIYSIGQLIMASRATLVKWPNMGKTTIGIVSRELRERFNTEW